MTKKLIIVESPSKAKTIQKYLGNDYIVESSYGHVRDLPSKDLSIDVENNFQPQYTISKDKKDIVKKLKQLAKESDEILLATDEDREGEAISWHLCHILGVNPEEAKRITYTEVTKDAILHALQNPRKIKMGLVNAQQARRVLDRLVGYELSPVLWRKVKPSLSAGRVQSVSVRLIVEREREIHRFKPVSTYKVTAIFTVLDKKGNPVQLNAELNHRFQTRQEARQFIELCNQASYSVANVQKKPVSRNPAAPFTTSTLQQEASRKLSFSVAKTMSVAQKLYEAGHITYMRTDSLSLSNTAIQSASKEIESSYGSDYVHVRQYKTKSKEAQEAHEAIRPTSFSVSAAGNSFDEDRLYELIWKRSIASQMSAAKLERTVIKIDVSDSDYQFQATGEILTFDGFLKVYLEGKDDEEDDDSVQGILPPVHIGQELSARQVVATERFSRPPARYTEASLVKKLEELGIGRPSTYAPTISTIQKRNYVVKDSRDGKARNYVVIECKQGHINEEVKQEITGAEKLKLFPTDIGMIVNDFLIEHFEKIMDYDFTAKMEEEFDDIAKGNTNWTAAVEDFYSPFHKAVEHTTEHAQRSTGERELGHHPESGEIVIARMGRYGPMVQIGKGDEEKKPQYAKLREHQHIETITMEEALELFKLPRDLGMYEDKPVRASIGRYGPYVVYDKLFVSIPKNGELDVYTIQLEQAIDLIKQKQEAEANKYIKEFKEDDISVLNGRYGPYIKQGRLNYRIPKNQDAASLTKEEVLEIIESQKNKKSKKRKSK